MKIAARIDYDKWEKLDDTLKEQIDKTYKEYQFSLENRRNALFSLVDLRGKCVKINREGETTLYLKIIEQFRCKNNSEVPSILIRGMGFRSYAEGSVNDNYAYWDSETDEYIRLDENFDKDLNEIEEISVEEFNRAFEEMLAGLKENYYLYLKYN